LGFDSPLPIELIWPHKRQMMKHPAEGCTTEAIADQITSFEEYNDFVGIREAVEREQRFTAPE
jgi:methylisocitrate lyase